ncbi:MAG: HNH endonuclease [Bacteroidetes bacterium]|nr:HNH endonuclease [Bacteroidota bacterium]
MCYKEGGCFIGSVTYQFIVDDNDCWLCQNRHIDDNGYVQVYYLGKMTRIHRAIYEDRNKVILPSYIQVRHLCDNPQCMNPDHLSIGTAHDNAMDKISHGRQPYGETIKTSILRESDVIEILTSTGLSIMELANKFKVYPDTIRKILNGKRWKHIYNKYTDSVPNKPKLKRAPNKPAIKSQHKMKSKETNNKVV